MGDDASWVGIFLPGRAICPICAIIVMSIPICTVMSEVEVGESMMSGQVFSDSSFASTDT